MASTVAVMPLLHEATSVSSAGIARRLRTRCRRTGPRPCALGGRRRRQRSPRPGRRSCGERRRQGVRRPEAPARGRAGAPLHLAPHARDRRARRRVHGVPQRRQCRDLRGRNEDRQRGRRDDDRPRIQPRLPAEAGARGRSAATPLLEVPEPRAGPTGCATSRFTADAGEVVGLGGLDGQGQRELLLALFGVLRGVSGEILVDGKPVSHHRARTRRRRSGSAWR